MTELELTRVPHDRRLYSLAGVGTVRLTGLLSHAAGAQADEQQWRIARRGVWRGGLEARDAAGTVVGEFDPRDIRRGGTLRWEGRELTLRPTSALRERYALRDGERELARLDGKGWGRRPVLITLLESDAIDPGLLLFAAFVVHRLAVNASGTASATSAATMSGSSS